MDEPQVVERMALIADDETAEVAEPGEEPLDLPTTLVRRLWRRIVQPQLSRLRAGSGEGKWSSHRVTSWHSA